MILPALRLEEPYVPQDLRHLPIEEERRRLATYRTATSDVSASAALGLALSTFQMWRRNHGLPAKYRPHGKPTPANEDERRELHARGLTDKEIARELGMKVTAIQKWRLMRGLAVNRVPRRTRIPEAEVLRRFLAWEMTNNDREAASLIGIAPESFHSFRRRVLRVPAKGVPTVGQRGHYVATGERERRLHAYQETTCDPEAADRLGMPRSRFTSWRLAQGFPAKRDRCSVCHQRIKVPRADGLKLCARHHDRLERKKRAPWHELAFQRRVHGLVGLPVVARVRAPGKGATWIRGILEENHKRLSIDGCRVPALDLLDVHRDYRAQEWACGCGCGTRIRFHYQPHHGPPFFVPGHKGRVRKNHGTFPRGHPPANKGLRGEAFWATVSEKGRARMLACLEAGHRTMRARAKGLSHDPTGHVYVLVGGTYPSGGPVRRARARVVMEGALGRPLGHDEIVWHVNQINDDDRPENLVLLPASDKGALSKGLRKGLRGREFLDWIEKMRVERDTLTSAERKRLRYAEKHDCERVPAGSSPICPACGMLRMPGGLHRCENQDALPPNRVASAPPVFSSPTEEG